MTWKPTPEVKALHDEHMQPVRDYATEFERAMRGCRRMVQERMTPKPCTCHPDDNPPVPCAQKYAYSECIK